MGLSFALFSEIDGLVSRDVPDVVVHLPGQPAVFLDLQAHPQDEL